MASLTHLVADGTGRRSWMVSPRRIEDPYGSSITMEIPTPALVLELGDGIAKKDFVEPDLAAIRCTLTERSPRSGFRRYGTLRPWR